MKSHAFIFHNDILHCRQNDSARNRFAYFYGKTLRRKPCTYFETIPHYYILFTIKCKDRRRIFCRNPALRRFIFYGNPRCVAYFLQESRAGGRRTCTRTAGGAFSGGINAGKAEFSPAYPKIRNRIFAPLCPASPLSARRFAPCSPRGCPFFTKKFYGITFFRKIY